MENVPGLGNLDNGQFVKFLINRFYIIGFEKVEYNYKFS